jgi:hypothetical protein
MQSKVTTIINAGTMTGTSVITSSTIDLSQASLLGLAFTWTGAAVGTLSCEVSHDASSWASFTITLPTVSNNAGTYAIQLADFAHQFLRIKYTNSSSSGVLTIKSCVKG